MDHVSDLFLETSMPLLVLIEAAKAGNEQQVEEFSQLFHDHANKLVEVLLTYLCYTNTRTFVVDSIRSYYDFLATGKRNKFVCNFVLLLLLLILQ